MPQIGSIAIHCTPGICLRSQVTSRQRTDRKRRSPCGSFALRGPPWRPRIAKTDGNMASEHEGVPQTPVSALSTLGYQGTTDLHSVATLVARTTWRFLNRSAFPTVLAWASAKQSARHSAMFPLWGLAKPRSGENTRCLSLVESALRFERGQSGGMADALDSKSCVLTGVWVRLPPLVLSAVLADQRWDIFSRGPPEIPTTSSPASRLS